MGNYKYKKQLIEIIKECLKQNYFMYNTIFCIQKLRSPMVLWGSNYLLFFPNYMSDPEEKFIEIYYTGNTKLRTTYVDSMMMIWENSLKEIKLFVNQVNIKDKNFRIQRQYRIYEID